MTLRTSILLSIIGLLSFGHQLARLVRYDKNTAWIYVCLFYSAWLLASVFILLKKEDLRSLFAPVKNWFWGLIGLPFVFIAFRKIFLPNLDLLQFDHWLAFHCIICLVNPFLEELYWRGLVSKFSERPLYSYLFSTIAFAASHPLILGVNSKGVEGWIGFAGTFIVGSMLWLVFFKTRSLWLAILIHFGIDFFGMAAYTLGDKAKLLDLPF